VPEQRVVITIDTEGAITAKTDGFKGESCLEALDELLDIEGMVTQVKKTDEYHQGTQLKQTNIQKIKGRE